MTLIFPASAHPDQSFIPILNQTTFQPEPWPEISPVVVGSKVFVTTSYSYECSWTNAGTGINCHRLVTQKDPAVLWLRNYAGVYGAEEVKGHLIEFIHGENKNEIVNGVALHNTVSDDTTCWSGYFNGGYQDCWQDYYGFASVNRDGKDLGPFLWPSGGYLRKDGTQASNGIRHPTSIATQRYIYVFYCDTSIHGIAVARSPKRALGQPGTFQTWTGKRWKPSLPVPFRLNSQSAQTALRQKGPPARAVVPGYFFAVTKVPGGYIGMNTMSEIKPHQATMGTQVWFSKDLIHWGRRGGLRWSATGSTNAEAFNALQVRYVRPLNDHVAIATNGSQVVRLGS